MNSPFKGEKVKQAGVFSDLSSITGGTETPRKREKEKKNWGSALGQKCVVTLVFFRKVPYSSINGKEKLPDPISQPIGGKKNGEGMVVTTTAELVSSCACKESRQLRMHAEGGQRKKKKKRRGRKERD